MGRFHVIILKDPVYAARSAADTGEVISEFVVGFSLQYCPGGAIIRFSFVLLLPISKQSNEFVNCVINSEAEIINLAGVEFTDLEAKGRFIERSVDFYYSNGGEVAKYLQLVGL